MFASVDVSAEDVARARAEFAASGVERRQIEAALAQGYARSWGRWIWPTGSIRTDATDTAWIHLVGDERAGRLRARCRAVFDGVGRGPPSERGHASSRVDAPSASDGRPLPYALGWFVQANRGYDLVWHYGHGLESSSLIVKIPERRVTFVILANSDGLSRWRSLGDNADVSGSPAAALFLNWYSSRKSR